jgi:hypothetical protein
MDNLIWPTLLKNYTVENATVDISITTSSFFKDHPIHPVNSLASLELVHFSHWKTASCTAYDALWLQQTANKLV